MAQRIDAAYPAIARWVMEYGWIEIGHDDMSRSFVRALSVGILWHPYYITPAQTADGHSPGRPLLCDFAQFITLCSA